MQTDLGRALATLQTPVFVACSRCEESYLQRAIQGGMCPDCRSTADAEALRANPAYRARVLTEWGVPARYAQPFDPVRQVPASVAAWDGRSPWLVRLHGASGLGKSFAAVELVWSLQVGLARWVAAHQLATVAYQEQLEYERSQGRAHREPWIIDDLGRGHSGGGWDLLHRVISRRYDGMLPTVITTNLSMREIAEASPAIADRMRDALEHTFRGASLRGPSGAQKA